MADFNPTQSESAPPPMQFDADALLDPDKARNGPLEVLWGQDEWIEPNHDLALPEPVWPRRKWWQMLMRWQRWHIAIRIAPPEGEDLEEWGQKVATQLGVPWGERKPGDKAVWLPATTWARTAGGALGSAGRAFKQLHGFKISQAQVRVWRAL